MNKSESFKIEPFGIRLHIICGEDDFIIKEMKSIEARDEVISILPKRLMECDAITYKEVYEDDGFLIDRLFLISKESIQSDIVAHESYHILNMVFETIGHTPSLDNDEIEAYVFQSIFSKINSFYNEG